MAGGACGLGELVGWEPTEDQDHTQCIPGGSRGPAGEAAQTRSSRTFLSSIPNRKGLAGASHSPVCKVIDYLCFFLTFTPPPLAKVHFLFLIRCTLYIVHQIIEDLIL